MNRLRPKSVIILFYLIGLTYCASGQILKIDKRQLSSDSSNYISGVVDVTFNLNNRGSSPERQNVYVGLNNNLDLVYFGEKSATLLIGGLNYYKIGDGPSIYNGSIHVREILRRAATLTPEVYVQVQFDQSRKMELRQLLGGGYRWNILRKKNSLYFGMGVFNERERWRGDVGLENKDLWKMNSYLSSDIKLSASSNVNTIVYFQTGYDEVIDGFRNRLSGQFEIKNALSKRVKVKLTSNILLDDKPIIPLNRFTYEMYFGMEYTF